MLLFLAVTLYLFLADPRGAAGQRSLRLTASRAAHERCSGLPRPPMALALAGSALLVVLAGAAFYYASVATRNRSTTTDELMVTIAGKVCEPNELTVPAGRRTFRIVNQSDRAVEWEILDGVMVVAERENIAPGITQTLTAKLVPGTYEITCGLLSNPRGTLVVTESEESVAEAARPPATSFIGPLAEFQLNLVLGADGLVEATRQFTDAAKAGDLDRARQLYLPARLAYARIEATAGRFADLATAIDGQADYFENGSRIQASKASIGSNTHCSATAILPVWRRPPMPCSPTSRRSQGRIAKLQPAPEQPLAATAALLGIVAQARVPHGTDRYAHADLAVLAAEIDTGGRSSSCSAPC